MSNKKEIIDRKKCTKCGKVKPFRDFRKTKNGKYGLSTWCSSCYNEYNINYHHSKKGLITRIRAEQFDSSKSRNINPPEYTRVELLNWATRQSEFHKLFAEWERSGWDKMFTPSINRIDNYGGYTLSNLEIISWKKHIEVTAFDIRNGFNNKNSKAIICTNIVSGEQKSYPSLAFASRETKVGRRNIFSICNGKLEKSKGFTFKYD